MLNFKKACLYHIDLARSNGSKNAVKNLHACQLYNTWCCAHRVDTARFLPRRALILAHLRANLEHLHVPAQRAAINASCCCCRLLLLWLVGRLLSTERASGLRPASVRPVTQSADTARIISNWYQPWSGNCLFLGKISGLNQAITDCL